MPNNSPPTKKIKKANPEVGSTKNSNFLNDIAAERKNVCIKYLLNKSYFFFYTSKLIFHRQLRQ